MLDADELGSPDCTLIGADWHIPVHRRAFPDHPTTQKTASNSVSQYYNYTGFLPRGKVCPADQLQLKAATTLPFVGLARSKQDPINRGHGAQYLYRPQPATAHFNS